MSAPPMCINCAGYGWEPHVYRGRVPCSFCAPTVTARPTGVPLTADNVADAQEATERRGGGATWRLHHWSGVASSWNDKRSFSGWSWVPIAAVLKHAARDGTVVTKWREP